MLNTCAPQRKTASQMTLTSTIVLYGNSRYLQAVKDCLTSKTKASLLHIRSDQPDAEFLLSSLNCRVLIYDQEHTNPDLVSALLLRNPGTTSVGLSLAKGEHFVRFDQEYACDEITELGYVFQAISN